MFKLKKNVKKVVGAALAGAVLVSSVQAGVPVNAASLNLNDSASTARPIYKYSNGIETYDAFKGSVSLCDTEWSEVKNFVNKNLLGVIGGKNYGSYPIGPGGFQNNNKITQYNYYCMANSSEEIVTGKNSNTHDQKRRVYLKDFGMTASKKNHFPEINDSSKWSVEVLKDDTYPNEWGNATANVWNKLTCQKCKYVTWKEGRYSDTDKVFHNEIKNVGVASEASDIKHYMCYECGTTGNWKVSSELELHHDASIKPAVVVVYEKNVPKKKTAKFGTINFYGYVNVNQPWAAKLSGNSVTENISGWTYKGETKNVTVKKGKKMYYHDAERTPVTLKTSKSSVVSVSKKMDKGGRYLVTAKKKGTATVTATNIWGHKYTFKITVK